MAILGLLLFSACSSSDRHTVDRLNSQSYAFHYRNIDSTEYYAREALKQSGSYADGKAEAYNNLAFVSIARMNYQQADSLLDNAISLTNNQVELLVAEVQRMRLCQRRSSNREFYEHRERATTHLKRINEERDILSERLQRRLAYAESELAIVNSAYYYYVGLERQSAEALQSLNLDEIRHDTAQYLNYLYNVGAGGIITSGTTEEIFDEEMDFLTRCQNISIRFDYPYFEAQAKEALAEHTSDISLAEEALQLFHDYGDVYQIAGAFRSMASCYHAQGDDHMALECLELALSSDTLINQAPDLVASIREQLSVAYSAVNDKQNSDYNRNIYIDLQEQTRQDRELEARAGILFKAVRQLNWMILAVVSAIVLLVFLLWLFNWLNRKQKENNLLDEVLEQKSDELKMKMRSVENSERLHLEQRAKVSLVNSVTPLIDRILYAIGRLENPANKVLGSDTDSQTAKMPEEEMEYIRELTDKINEQNELLTKWIQMRQGELRLHIESFPLQPLFDIVGRSRAAFAMNKVTLNVEPTDAVVKADCVLTLFMLNTLADNARKFTDAGGSVEISAREADSYVEVSVADTGRGMSEDELKNIFEHKIVAGHGFGLMNCKGIIEKYRKMSQLFIVCHIGAESEHGKGSRFFFRLPKGIRRIILLVAVLTCQLNATTLYAAPMQTNDYMSKAHIFADSAYFCNINGTYERTLQFADSCRKYLNQCYLSKNPKGKLLMLRDGDTSQTPPEIQWYHDNVDVNYQIILDIRNESAVASLALHEWKLYAYNNKIYTQLFKEISADNTLGDYCRTMQQSQTNKRIAVILLVVILLCIVPAYYMLYYRQRLNNRQRRERVQLDNIEMLDDELRRMELEDNKLHVANAVLDNCLSTLKHETMYYPSRIRQLVDTGDVKALDEVTRYYREIYGILSEQAMKQVEQVKLHIRKTECYGETIMADETMIRYLFDILKPKDVKTESKLQYVTFNIQRESSLSEIDFMLCRQILRDHGEATHRRGCGIMADNNNIQIILPRYNGQL